MEYELDTIFNRTESLKNFNQTGRDFAHALETGSLNYFLGIIN